MNFDNIILIRSWKSNQSANQWWYSQITGLRSESWGNSIASAFLAIFMVPLRSTSMPHTHTTKTYLLNQALSSAAYVRMLESLKKTIFIEKVFRERKFVKSKVKNVLMPHCHRCSKNYDFYKSLIWLRSKIDTLKLILPWKCMECLFKFYWNNTTNW